VTLIRAENVGIRFLFDRQRNVVPPTLARLRRRGSETWGLRGLNFTIHGGDGVALIGPSGSGKTTLLRTIAGVLDPDTGQVAIRGRLASLLSIDAGLLPVLTGRENAQLLSVLAGLPRRQANAKLDGIKARSGLEAKFERPVLSFSQGMRARLGFAVAESVDPEILLLDEVHEALDHEFRTIVERRARSILNSGGIVVAAGHDHPMLERLCNRAFLLKEGSLQADGAFADVQRSYLSG
jgi:ABC-type polysaccharide/polyol phosphate transport system ATPase subunit